MVAKFDNLDDVAVKFQNTICYYKKKPVMVKQVNQKPMADGEFILSVCGLSGKPAWIDLNDPEFDYKNFNIGYANGGPYAMWWYRLPIRQWRQGLKRDQLGWLATNKWLDDHFGFSKPYTQMLENAYPALEMCKKSLVDAQKSVVAFHKDFALSWDLIHRDYILEYRGKQIGCSTSAKCTSFRLTDDMKHLKEVLKEIL